MRHFRLLSAALLAVLLLPALASATHIVGEASFDADCNEWNFNALVQIRPTIDEAMMYMTFTFTKVGEEEPVLTVSDEAVILTNAEDLVDVMLTNTWNSMTDETIPLYGLYEVHASFNLYAPFPGGIDDETVEFSVLRECDVVDNEDASWGGVKSTYR